MVYCEVSHYTPMVLIVRDKKLCMPSTCSYYEISGLRRDCRNMLSVIVT